MTSEIKNNPFGNTVTQIMDPVHGGISVLQHEKHCIDHPLFQRLRYILQNDVANHVFPGAVHTRFNHSLGTMHIAGRLYRSLVNQYIGEAKKDFLVTDAHRNAIYYICTCFRLAALLHDTGHFPFSHEFEQTPAAKKLLHEKSILRDFWGSSTLYEKYAKNSLEKPDFEISHEDYSLAIAHKILSEVAANNGLPVDIDDVLALMESFSGENSPRWTIVAKLLFEVFEGSSKNPHAHSDEFIANGFRSFFGMMISGEVDVDKMDYLLRDSYFSGAKYGIYNVDHLISTIRIGVDPKSQWVGLALLEKGVVALEDFVYSRFQIYQNMWSHKAVIGSKLLLSDAISEAIQSDLSVNEIRNYISDMSKFSLFTDHYFLEKFRSEALRNTNSACANFLFRKKPRHLGRLTDPSNVEIALKQTDLEKTSANKVKQRYTKIKFSEIKDRNFSDIRVIVKKESGERGLVELKTKTKFFDKFGEMLIVNYYESQCV